jgi:hypothetical protein
MVKFPEQYMYTEVISKCGLTVTTQAWLELIDEAIEEKNESLVSLNCEAQHRYLTWRAEKVSCVNSHSSCLDERIMASYFGTEHKIIVSLIIYSIKLFVHLLVKSENVISKI